MKYLKKYETSDDDQYKATLVEDIFIDIWGGTLIKHSKVWCLSNRNYRFAAIFSLKEKMSTKTYKEYYKIFDILDNLNIIFVISNDQLRFECNSLDELLNELKLLNNSKKYNL
jgi:hypothetical protein